MGKALTAIETFVSIVLILNEAKDSDFERYIHQLQRYLGIRYSDYEIVIIDDNQKPFPSSTKKNILNNIPSIRWITLSFPVHMDVALSAGIENSIGDFVLLLRPTVDPIVIVSDMIGLSSQGYDVVIGIAEQPRTIGYKIARTLSNNILHSINYHIPRNATPVRCLSRRAINTVLRTGQISHQFFVKVANTGYPCKQYKYKLLKSGLVQKKTLTEGIAQTIHLMIFNSTKPLRWISLLGIIGSLSAFIFAIYSLVINLLKDNVIEGWTSMVFFTSFLFMILFIILAFLGEYLARLLNEKDDQYSYYISNEDRSSVMIETDRFNVLDQS